jgi:hypothetical protein
MLVFWVDWYVDTNVSRNTLPPSSAPLKHWHRPTSSHSVRIQKTNIEILTAVRSLNLKVVHIVTTALQASQNKELHCCVSTPRGVHPQLGAHGANEGKLTD